MARLQSDFVAAVSHEFRTPLTSLRQITEMLHDGRVARTSAGATYYDALAARRPTGCTGSSSRCSISAAWRPARSPYRRSRCDLRVVGSVGRRRVQPRSRGARLHVELVDRTSRSPCRRGDREALTNALWNLLDNAVKYSPECRTVWVDGRSQRRRRAPSACAIAGSAFRADEQREIFRKFVRGADAKRRGHQGHGHRPGDGAAHRAGARRRRPRRERARHGQHVHDPASGRTHDRRDPDRRRRAGHRARPSRTTCGRKATTSKSRATARRRSRARPRAQLGSDPARRHAAAARTASKSAASCGAPACGRRSSC